MYNKEFIFNNLELFIDIIDKVSDLVFFVDVKDENIFRYLYINQQARELMKKENQEIVGKTIEDIMPFDIAKMIIVQYKQAIEKRETITYEDYSVDWTYNIDTNSYLPHKYKYFESKVSPIFDQEDKCVHIVAIVRDITDRKLTEIALKESEEKYRLIADNMTDLVSIINIDGIIKYVSPSHKSVLGWPVDSYIGKPAFEFIHPDDLPNVINVFDNIIKHRNMLTVEFRRRHANENWVWVEGKLTAVLDDKNNVSHILLVARDIMERKKLEGQLTYMAYHDMLSKLPNRRLFKMKLKQAFNQIAINKQTLAVMYLDIDDFKIVNDSLGHDIGDELIYHFSERVKACLGEKDVLARIGGDEFCALLHINTRQDAYIIADRILIALQREWIVKGHNFFTTSSIGISFYVDGIDDETLIKNADLALYKAKEKGKNNYQIFDT